MTAEKQLLKGSIGGLVVSEEKMLINRLYEVILKITGHFRLSRTTEPLWTFWNSLSPTMAVGWGWSEGILYGLRSQGLSLWPFGTFSIRSGLRGGNGVKDRLNGYKVPYGTAWLFLLLIIKIIIFHFVLNSQTCPSSFIKEDITGHYCFRYA